MIQTKVLTLVIYTLLPLFRYLELFLNVIFNTSLLQGCEKAIYKVIYDGK